MNIGLAWLVKESSSEAVAYRPRKYPFQDRFSLRGIWTVSQIIFCACMTSTFFVNSVDSAYVLVAVLGLPWAVGTWIPFTLVSQDLQRQHGGYAGVGSGEDHRDLVATVVGIHNSAISAPQIVAAIGSWFFFLVANSSGAATGSSGIEVWLLRASGIAGLVAAWIINGLPEETEKRVVVCA